jgi:hypothetical protein
MIICCSRCSCRSELHDVSNRLHDFFDGRLKSVCEFLDQMFFDARNNFRSTNREGATAFRSGRSCERTAVSPVTPSRRSGAQDSALTYTWHRNMRMQALGDDSPRLLVSAHLSAYFRSCRGSDVSVDSGAHALSRACAGTASATAHTAPAPAAARTEAA